MYYAFYYFSVLTYFFSSEDLYFKKKYSPIKIRGIVIAAIITIKRSVMILYQRKVRVTIISKLKDVITIGAFAPNVSCIHRKTPHWTTVSITRSYRGP